jgi:hypothetical protein
MAPKESLFLNDRGTSTKEVELEKNGEEIALDRRGFAAEN